VTDHDGEKSGEVTLDVRPTGAPRWYSWDDDTEHGCCSLRTDLRVVFAVAAALVADADVQSMNCGTGL